MLAFIGKKGFDLLLTRQHVSILIFNEIQHKVN